MCNFWSNSFYEILIVFGGKFSYMTANEGIKASLKSLIACRRGNVGGNQAATPPALPLVTSGCLTTLSLYETSWLASCGMCASVLTTSKVRGPRSFCGIDVPSPCCVVSNQ